MYQVMMLRLSRKDLPYNVCAIAASMLVFFLSLIISPYYVSGDQIHYRLVYEALPSLGILDGYRFYNKSLTSFEVVLFVIAWLSSRVVEKDIVMAMANGCLAYFALLLLKKWRVYFLIGLVVVLTNYYFLVFYFSAERLKFGIIFLLLSLIYIDRAKFLYLSSILAVFSHVQFILFYSGFLIYFFLKNIKRVLISGSITRNLLLVTVTFLITVFFIRDQLMSKFIAYFELRSVSELLKTAVFFGFSLWYSRKRIETVIVFVLLLTVVFLVGGDRVNFVAYFVFLFYALRINRGINVGVLTTSAYFMWASYGYLVNIIKYGNGFYLG